MKTFIVMCIDFYLDEGEYIKEFYPVFVTSDKRKAEDVVAANNDWSDPRVWLTLVELDSDKLLDPKGHVIQIGPRSSL